MSHATDLVMHIDELVGFGHRRALEHSVEDQAGVESAHFNDQHPHLMVVGYDPDQIDSAKIIERVTRNQLHASRVS